MNLEKNKLHLLILRNVEVSIIILSLFYHLEKLSFKEVNSVSQVSKSRARPQMPVSLLQSAYFNLYAYCALRKM